MPVNTDSPYGIAMATNVQYGMKRNTEELQSFLKDLNRWTEDIKKEDEQLRSQESPATRTLPAVRGVTAVSHASKSKPIETKKESSVQHKSQQKNASRISSYDYRSWDKFDVNAALEAVDDNDDKVNDASSPDEVEESGSGYSSEDDQLEEERQLQLALIEKDRGNEFFKGSHYNEAIQCYTRGIEADPNNVLLYANRAMALLKQEKFAACELDCDRTIELDPTYVKGFARRGMARLALGKLEDSRRDFCEVLRLEPGNKQASTELIKIDKRLGIYKEPPAVISAVKRPAHLRSKKPLIRIPVEDIGTGSEEDEDEEGEQDVNRCTETKASDELQTEKIGNQDDITTQQLNKEEKPREMIEVIETKPEQTNGTREIITEEQANSREQPSDTSVTTETTLSIVKEIQEPAKQQPNLQTPTTAYQFETVWKRVRNSPNLVHNYIKMIPPNSYPKLFQQSLEDVLMKLLTCFHDFYMPDNQSFLEQLECLTKVKRFSMVAMFLSSKEKQVVHDLLDHLRRKQTASDQAIDRLRKAYGL